MHARLSELWFTLSPMVGCGRRSPSLNGGMRPIAVTDCTGRVVQLGGVKCDGCTTAKEGARNPIAVGIAFYLSRAVDFRPTI